MGLPFSTHPDLDKPTKPVAMIATFNLYQWGSDS